VEIKGILTAKGKKIGIVVSRFNEVVSDKLLEGAKEALLQHQADDELIDIVWVPGSFEIPLTLKKLIETGRYDGLIALGCIVRGDTPHFEFVASEVTKGIARVTLESGTPVSFGIVTADTLDQALDRAGGKMGNRGREAVLTLLETISVIEKLSGKSSPQK
jgi:6,7-dimethyl-8-ribityllumazine synthase